MQEVPPSRPAPSPARYYFYFYFQCSEPAGYCAGNPWGLSEWKKYVSCLCWRVRARLVNSGSFTQVWLADQSRQLSAEHPEHLMQVLLNEQAFCHLINAETPGKKGARGCTGAGLWRNSEGPGLYCNEQVQVCERSRTSQGSCSVGSLLAHRQKWHLVSAPLSSDPSGHQSSDASQMPTCDGYQFRGPPHHPATPGLDKWVLHGASGSSEGRAPHPSS